MNSKNKVVINDDDIIEIFVIGDQTRDSILPMGNETRACLEKLAAEQKPGLILDDLTQLGQTDIPARQAVSDLAKTLPFKKVAMVGQPNLLMRYGTKLLLQAIGMGNKIKYFENRDEAIRWLKS